MKKRWDDGIRTAALARHPPRKTSLAACAFLATGLSIIFVGCAASDQSKYASSESWGGGYHGEHSSGRLDPGYHDENSGGLNGAVASILNGLLRR
jgi:hypothetical protein